MSAPEPDSAVEPASDRPVRGRNALQRASLIALGTAFVTVVVMAYAFNPARAGEPAMLVAIGLMDASLAVVAVLRLRRRGELRQLFRPATGDLTLGAVTAGALYGLAMLTHVALTGRGSPREGWIIRLYFQLGDPTGEGHAMVGAAVFVIAAMEETVWRGMVMRALEEPLGPKKALVISSVLFAFAHLPTAVLLRDPQAGWNPLIVAAGLGCSLVWGLLMLRSRRIVPSLFAHAFFSWAIVEFPIWRP
jgi:uncharacterized protein